MDRCGSSGVEGGDAAAQIVAAALDAARGGGDRLNEALGALPVPVYVTDADGWLTFFNPACVAFAGRVPVTGEDRWCVSWKLYTEDGTPMAHDRCPMAVTVRQRRPVRGVTAIAERPDGTRALFTPYPTPLFDAEGIFVGAVNILIAVDGQHQAKQLLVQAERCRRLSALTSDRQTADTLAAMALEYEEKARAFSRPH